MLVNLSAEGCEKSVLVLTQGYLDICLLVCKDNKDSFRCNYLHTLVLRYPGNTPVLVKEPYNLFLFAYCRYLVISSVAHILCLQFSYYSGLFVVQFSISIFLFAVPAILPGSCPDETPLAVNGRGEGAPG